MMWEHHGLWISSTTIEGQHLNLCQVIMLHLWILSPHSSHFFSFPIYRCFLQIKVINYNYIFFLLRILPFISSFKSQFCGVFSICMCVFFLVLALIISFKVFLYSLIRYIFSSTFLVMVCVGRGLPPPKL